MKKKSEYRLDATIEPEAALRGDQLFVELSGLIALSSDARDRVDRDLGKHLAHLPPNLWSPLTQISHREVQASPASRWQGTIALPLTGGTSVLPIEWRLQWLERDASGTRAVVRAGFLAEFAARKAACESLAALQPEPGGPPQRSCEGKVVLPGGVEQGVSARIERAVDALDLVNLDDDLDETHGLLRQRHEYSGIPTVIELWSMGEYDARTWMMLLDDVTARFGSVDLRGVEALVQPSVSPGRLAEAHVHSSGMAVIVNESGKA